MAMNIRSLGDRRWALSKGAVLALLLLSALYLTLGYIRSESGLIHAFDTGIYLQILSNLSAGRGWASSITGEHLFLAHHFQPIIALLLPLHALLKSPFALLLVSGIFSLGSSLLLMAVLPAKGIASRSSSTWIGLAFFLHPTISSRIYYSFVPEVMALPALCYLACLLAKDDRLHRREWAGFIFSLLWIALCKETLWLTSAWVAIVLAIRHRKAKEAPIFWALGAAFILGFLYLFLSWMPSHSDLGDYYGLVYYQNDLIGGQWGLAGKILGAALNLISLQSLGSFVVAALLIPIGLTLFGGYWALLGALPAMALIMAAQHNQIHDLTNHYLLGALPFLAVASAIGLDQAKLRIDRSLRAYLGLAALLVPAAVTLLHNSGFIFQTLFASQRMNTELVHAAAVLRQTIEPDDVILIDGSLQPLFSDLPHVKIILGFQGNPTHVTPEDLARVKHVVTTNDLAAIKDCRALKPGEGDLSVFDYAGFYQYCEWLKKETFEKTDYIPNRLIDLKVKPGI